MGVSKKARSQFAQVESQRSNQYYVLEGRANMQLKVVGDMVLAQSGVVPIAAGTRNRRAIMQ